MHLLLLIFFSIFGFLSANYFISCKTFPLFCVIVLEKQEERRLADAKRRAEKNEQRRQTKRVADADVASTPPPSRAKKPRPAPKPEIPSVVNGDARAGGEDGEARNGEKKETPKKGPGRAEKAMEEKTTEEKKEGLKIGKITLKMSKGNAQVIATEGDSLSDVAMKRLPDSRSGSDLTAARDPALVEGKKAKKTAEPRGKGGATAAK